MATFEMAAVVTDSVAFVIELVMAVWASCMTTPVNVAPKAFGPMTMPYQV